MAHRVKIAWLTPLAKESAIGLFSCRVTAKLAAAADVDLWHPPARELHPAVVRRIQMPESFAARPAALSNYDLIVYNLGNHAGLHGEVFEVSRAVPGLVILHDFVMHHFFAGHFLPKDSGAYLRAMTAAYGEAGRAAANAVLAGVRPCPWETNAMTEFPLFEEAVRGAWAVIVHSDFLASRVAARFPGPVKHLPLAYDRKTGPVRPRSALRVPPDRTLMLSVGHVTPQRRTLEVLEVLNRCPDLSRQITWAILGPAEDAFRQQLTDFIRRHGLENAVRFTGRYAAEADVHAYLAHADFCMNLRFPVTEGGSASVAEQMLFGKPVIVTDTGCYRELPDDCVRKVRLEHEAEDLESALRDLLGNRAARKQMGERARSFAERTFTARGYAAGFLELAEEILDAKPLLALTDRLGAELGQMGADEQSPIVRTVAEETYRLFCTGRDEPAT